MGKLTMSKAISARELAERLWIQSGKTWYYTYYVELLANPLIDRWERLDLIVRILIALTASGSAVAGWQLWQQTGLREVWIFIAGFAALSSIFHSTLNVTSRVRYWCDVKKEFSAVRHKLQILRYRITVEPHNIEKLHRNYLEYADRYAQLDNSRRDTDLFLSHSLREKVQNILDEKRTGTGSYEEPEN